MECLRGKYQPPADCQARELAPPQRSWEPAWGSEQDSDLFRMDWGRKEEEAKGRSPGREWGGGRRALSMEEKKIWGSHIPMVGMEPEPLPAALRRGRAPSPILAVGICPRLLARWGRSLNLQTPNHGPPISPISHFTPPPTASHGPVWAPAVPSSHH